MKLYIAGVAFYKPSGKCNSIELTSCLIKQLAQINQDGIYAFGEDVVVFVVLHEYALTPQAIPNALKKKCLGNLQEAIKQYKNMILVPGSFSAYDAIQETGTSIENKKKTKLLKCYTDALSKKSRRFDLEFLHEYHRARELPEKMRQHYLQNSAYLLSGNSKLKHKKAFPYQERGKLPYDLIDKTIYHIGDDDPVKKILINNQSVNICLTICYEHTFIDNEHEQIVKNPPFIQIISSASIHVIESNLVGIINIHIDKAQDLSVYINDSLINTNRLSYNNIKAVMYHIANNEILATVDVKTNHFKMPIKDRAPNKQPISNSQSLTNSIFGFKSGLLINKTTTTKSSQSASMPVKKSETNSKINTPLNKKCKLEDKKVTYCGF